MRSAINLRIITRDQFPLSYTADSIAPEEREPWLSRGVRKIITKNFYIYYRPDEVSGRVYVLKLQRSNL